MAYESNNPGDRRPQLSGRWKHDRFRGGPGHIANHTPLSTAESSAAIPQTLDLSVQAAVLLRRYDDLVTELVYEIVVLRAQLEEARRHCFPTEPTQTLAPRSRDSRSNTERICPDCQNVFKRTGPRQQRCPECAKTRWRNQQKRWRLANQNSRGVKEPSLPSDGTSPIAVDASNSSDIPGSALSNPVYGLVSTKTVRSVDGEDDL